MRKVGIVWAVSLIVIGFTTVILAMRMLGLELPDAAVRALGIAELIALPALAFATVRLTRKRR